MGPNAVTWFQLTTGGAGKCNLVHARDEKAMGFGEHIANSDIEVQVSPPPPYAQRVAGHPEKYMCPHFLINLEMWVKTDPVTSLPSPTEQDPQRRARLG